MEKIEDACKLAEDILKGKKMSTCPDGLYDKLTDSTADQDFGDVNYNTNFDGLGKGRNNSEVFKDERIDSESLSDNSMSYINVEEDKTKSPGSMTSRESVPDVPKSWKQCNKHSTQLECLEIEMKTLDRDRQANLKKCNCLGDSVNVEMFVNVGEVMVP